MAEKQAVLTAKQADRVEKQAVVSCLINRLSGVSNRLSKLINKLINWLWAETQAVQLVKLEPARPEEHPAV